MDVNQLITALSRHSNTAPVSVILQSGDAPVTDVRDNEIGGVSLVVNPAPPPIRKYIITVQQVGN